MTYTREELDRFFVAQRIRAKQEQFTAELALNRLSKLKMGTIYSHTNGEITYIMQLFEYNTSTLWFHILAQSKPNPIEFDPDEPVKLFWSSDWWNLQEIDPSDLPLYVSWPVKSRRAERYLKKGLLK